MSKRIFVLNADDFGMSEAYNKAVLEGFTDGILKSASLVANGEAFDEAVNKVIPSCPGLGVGIHLNIIEGKALTDKPDKLCDEHGNFNNSYVQMLLKAYNKKDDSFMKQVEEEFRAQIEKIMSKVAVTHIDSHVHTHSIPPIFELVCKLAKEYGITQVRTQYEKPYIVPDIQRHLNFTYPVNLVKLALLNTLTAINKNTVKKYGLKTNDYLIGVTYTSMMDSLTISYGLKANKYEKAVVEALIHPCRYENGTIDSHFVEYQITKNKKLKDRIEELEFEISNYIKKDEIQNEQ